MSDFQRRVYGETVNIPDCVTCKWATSKTTCQAFPNGIPDRIRTGRDRHDEPYPGDNGIQYERK